MAFVQHYTNGAVLNRALTHPSLHLRDAHDAQIILEAVRRNVLPLIKRRLVASERDQLRAGNVFVWEEADDEGGLLRWTDGRRWSQSRMRGDYLFYEEKVETTQDERDAKAARRAKRTAAPGTTIPPPTRRKDRPSKPNGLTKQTYSALVHPPGSKEGRKWHVVAYFLSKDHSRLPTIDQYDDLRSIQVPKGVITTAKSIPQYSDDDCPRHDSSESISSTPSPMSVPLSPALSSMSESQCDDDVRHWQSNVLLHTHSQSDSNAHAHPYPYPHHHHPHHPQRPTLLRTMSEGPAPQNMLPMPRPSESSYSPLSPEDRKMLSSFRVAL